MSKRELVVLEIIEFQRQRKFVIIAFGWAFFERDDQRRTSCSRPICEVLFSALEKLGH